MSESSRMSTLIKIDATIAGPWAVGAATPSRSANLPVLTDPRGARADTPGKPWLPMTTLVGSLRAHLSAADQETADAWFGDPWPSEGDPDPDRPDARTTPSKLRALGATLGNCDGAVRMTRRARQSSVRRAAEAGGLWDEQRVEPDDAGSTTVRMVFEHLGPADQTILNVMRSWTARIGRNQGVGFGALSVSQVTAVTVDLALATHLTWWLTRRGQWMGSDPANDSGAPPGALTYVGDGGPSQKPWTLTGRWRIVDPVHVGDPTSTPAPSDETDGRQARPRVVRRQPGRGGKRGIPVIPGTAWKGVFRHRAEFILRSLGVSPDSSPVIEELFGLAPRKLGNDNLPGRRGALRFLDSAIREATEDKRSQVAIDRISGGAADSKLFAMERVTGGTFELTIEADSEPSAPAVLLLKAVIRDLDDGLIGVGAAGTRGFGTVEMADPTPVWEPLTPSTFTTGASS